MFAFFVVFLQGQRILRKSLAFGFYIQTPDYEVFEETETPTEEELRAVEEGLRDIEAGNIVSHEEVMQGARNIIESYKERWRRKEA